MITIPETTKSWLIESPIPSVRYGAAELFRPGSGDRELLLTDPLVADSLDSLKNWKGEVLKQHNKPDLLIHRLAFLADAGVTRETPGMEEIGQIILDSFDTNQVPRIMVLIPKAFRGSGEVESAWIICDYPQILYALLKMGFVNDRTLASVRFLAGLSRENGMPCLSSLEGFRGPGPKKDFCPIASLYSLKALNQVEETRRGEAALRASASLLSHWNNRDKKKYFMFGVGTDYGKLKYPLVWYNLLHVLNVLSESMIPDNPPALDEMAKVLLLKGDEELRYTPESMYMFYKGQDFANKKEPSPTLTLTVLSILKRLGKIDL
ncbi:MAG: hypothetical protein JXA95_16775 [Spirochaetales bacterium]|nr:hypothetical protein [Spirochaetales bacterium]